MTNKNISYQSIPMNKHLLSIISFLLSFMATSALAHTWNIGNEKLSHVVTHQKLAKAIYGCTVQDMQQKDFQYILSLLNDRDKIRLKTDSVSEIIEVRDAALACIEEHFGENFLQDTQYSIKSIVLYNNSNNELWRVAIRKVSDEDFKKARVKIEARIRMVDGK